MEMNHFDKSGNALMVDTGGKGITLREAEASGIIRMSAEALAAIEAGSVKKGDVLGIARIAGIMAVKKTPALIPLCHPLIIDGCSVDFEVDAAENEIKARCTVRLEGKTGAEMEALTGVSAALLTIYDMCKAIDRTMEISRIHLVKKSGGKSGAWENPAQCSV